VIAVIVLTHNRAHLLRRCVEHVLLRTSPATSEIVIWDNASVDDTRSYLEGVTDARLKVVHHEENIGTNAYTYAAALTSSPFIVEVDDDVIDAPHHWDKTLLEAFRAIPRMGYLVADLKEDPNDSAYNYLKYVKEQRNVYTRKVVGGINILEGPTGGGCALTSREVYERVGGFRQNKELVFWHEAAAYVQDVLKLGYRTAILEDLKVWHAGSPYYSKPSPAKAEFHKQRRRVNARKDFVKRIVLALPFASALNGRYRWFDPPDTYEPPDFGRSWE
jgi:GT2 family glycosyltransferase